MEELHQLLSKNQKNSALPYEPQFVIKKIIIKKQKVLKAMKFC